MIKSGFQYVPKRILGLFLAIGSVFMLSLMFVNTDLSYADGADTVSDIATYSTRSIYGHTEHVYSESRVSWETLEKVEQNYMYLPEWVRNVFEDNHWQLWIIDDFEEYGFGSNTAGLTVYNENCVYLRNSSSGLELKVLFHEIGHVIDRELRTSGVYLSGTAEFRAMYDKFWDDFCNTFNYSHFKTDEKELFAESCYHYWSDPYEFKADFPEIFNYIDTAFTNYSGVSVLDYFPVSGLHNEFGSLTYYKDGVRDKSYTGFADCDGEKYYVTGGYVIKRNGIMEDGNTGNWYYVIDGEVQSDYTGVSNFSNEYGWWYIRNGKVDFSRTSIDQNQYGWWRVVNGKVDFSCNSIEQNDYGWWYLLGGKVQFNYTGVGNYPNDYGWWYINNGKVDFSQTSIEPNTYGWWRIVNGKVDFSCNSVEQNRYGWWYLLGGKVQFSFNGVADYANPYGWWYIRNGGVDFSYTGLSANKYGTWYIRNGQVDFGYSGVVDGQRIREGKVA